MTAEINRMKWRNNDIGIPKEIKEGENRVSMTPAGVHALVLDGHTVLVEARCGTSEAASPMKNMRNEGAEIVDNRRSVFARSDMIVKVKEPLEIEWPLLQEGQITFYLSSPRLIGETHKGAAQEENNRHSVRDHGGQGWPASPSRSDE